MSPELSHYRYSLDVAFPQVYTTVEKLNKLPLFHDKEEIKMEIRHIIIPLSVIILILKTGITNYSQLAHLFSQVCM